MSQYYTKSLSGERLKKCYDIAPPPVKQFLQDEIDFIAGFLSPDDIVLELGSGYGRVIQKLSLYAKQLTGIDNAPDNIELSATYCSEVDNCQCFFMDANRLDFKRNHFDVVLCIQNGISAFKINEEKLISEIFKVLKPDGKALFSSYSPMFWENRLQWFRLQSQHGLLGEIDEQATGNGVIICKDGFKATTFSEDDFAQLGDRLGLKYKIQEVNNSLVFCEYQNPT